MQREKQMSNLISRQAAIDALKVAYWDKEIQSAKDDPCIVDAMTDWAIRTIKELPSADRPTGKWELIESEHVENIYLCSNCRNYEAWGETEKTPYCPQCGARMEV